MEQTHLLLFSHGCFAQELVKSAEMIIGSMEEIHVFPLLPGTSMEDYREMIVSYIIRTGEFDNYLCMIDLYGGTPSTTVLSLMKDYHINAITGLNLAMLIEVYSMREKKENDELCHLAYETLLHSSKKFYYKELTFIGKEK